jgi:hypothetical protein
LLIKEIFSNPHLCLSYIVPVLLLLPISNTQTAAICKQCLPYLIILILPLVGQPKFLFLLCRAGSSHLPFFLFCQLKAQFASFHFDCSFSCCQFVLPIIAKCLFVITQEKNDYCKQKLLINWSATMCFSWISLLFYWVLIAATLFDRSSATLINSFSLFGGDFLVSSISENASSVVRPEWTKTMQF